MRRRAGSELSGLAGRGVSRWLPLGMYVAAIYASLLFGLNALNQPERTALLGWLPARQPRAIIAKQLDNLSEGQEV